MIVQNIGDAHVLQVARYEHGTSLQMGGVKSWINFFDGLVFARGCRGLKPGECGGGYERGRHDGCVSVLVPPELPEGRLA